jgi:uncharacterized SAM-binding protein YcdF (DUF218 family)
MTITDEARAAAQIIWDYHQVNHELKATDAIWVLCSHDLRVADRAVELFENKLAPRIIFSGGFGNFTAGVFEKPEADLFAERALELGIPETAILRENQSSDCGENVICTQRLLRDLDLKVESVIAVQKPYMERRTFATIRRQWSEMALRVTSPQLSFDEYCTAEIPMEKVIGIMVGDFQRIMEYPRLGFQIEQDVTDEAKAAFEFLAGKGFDWHLMKK